MRQGILAGGNFIIDYVKLINAYPEQDMLADIRSETVSNGGGPYNVLKDLAAMRVTYPLEAAGLVGKDANGDWIIADCARAGIQTKQLSQTAAAPTSYTDAMTVIETGRRTFFHQRGANARFGKEPLDFSQTKAKIFHLGYLMLLDEMDRILPDGQTPAAKTLAKARESGLLTSVDIVSTENPHFRTIAEASLPHTDYLIINEVEAGKIVGMNLKAAEVNVSAAGDAARALIEKGVQRQVVIHFESGAVAAEKDGSVTFQPSLNLPPGFILGATGAGDAFAAGYLHGLHEGYTTAEGLTLAVCTAAACLAHPTPSEGLRTVEDCLRLAEEYGFRIPML